MSSGSLACLYPGQGSQLAGMLHALPDHPVAQQTIDEAAAVLGGIDNLDSAAALDSTTNSQLALVICGVAGARTFAEDYHCSPQLVAGHSVGAFAAAVTAGVLTFPEALEAVRLRGELMSQACASGQWGMAALSGLRLREVRDLLLAVGADSDQLWIANINSADQIVLAGSVAALDTAERAAQRAGARQFQTLDVHIASHGPLQHDTAVALAAHLADIPVRAQTAAYLCNTSARRVRNDSRAVLDDLATSVAQPVRWYDIARLLPELGVTAAVQMPPGHVLSHLTSAAAPEVATFSAADDGFAAIAARLRRS